MKDFWNERYGGEDYVYGEAPNELLVDFAARIPPGPVLLLGEGEGRNAVFLAERGHEVTAVDQSAVGLAKAQALAGRRGVAIHTVEADLADYELGAGWSAIVSVWCHLPSGLRRQVHAAIPAALVPGGVFFCVAYTPAQIAFGTGGPRDPDMLVTAEDLSRELPGLSWEVLREEERDIHEGPHHDGRSAIVVGLGLR
jgi:SAM-dependent methyltransferase